MVTTIDISIFIYLAFFNSFQAYMSVFENKNACRVQRGTLNGPTVLHVDRKSRLRATPMQKFLLEFLNLNLWAMCGTYITT